MKFSKLLLALVICATALSVSRTAEAARPACTPDATWAVVDGAVAGVRVWYETSRPADLAQAQAIVSILDSDVWPNLITGLGFQAPMSDIALGCNGGDGRLDIFVVASPASRGATRPEPGTDHQSSTYIEIRNAQSGTDLQYVVTHQFMHAVQWSYPMMATQVSYGWMRNAMANWAVEAVYPSNPRLLADASCHMNSTFLSITILSTGSCSNSTTRTRDYGAYLLFQYIGRTAGNAKVRDILAATTGLATALEAIDANVTGGLKALWPRFAKALWNRPPVTDPGRNAYKNWDGLTTVPVLAPDRPTTVNANLAGLRNASTTLATSVANTSTRFYRFTFSEIGTRSLMFHNTFYPLYKANKKVTVQAMWRTEAGTWVEENWTQKEWIGLCRDLKAQRVVEVVIVVASAETGPVTQVVAATAPTFKRNNIGCWGFRGPVKRTEVRSTWSSGSIVARGTALFDYKPNGTGTTQYNDAATGRLRVPIAAPLFRRIAWTLTEGYTDSPCSFSLNAGGTDTSIVLGGLGFGSIVINNFAESLPSSLRQSQYQVVGNQPGAYHVNLASQRFGLPGTVSGPQPDCGTQYFSAPGLFLLTNASPPGVIIAQDGRLRGTFVSSSSPDSVIFEWSLEPLREP